MKVMIFMLVLSGILGQELPECGIGHFYDTESRTCMECVAECEYCGRVKFASEECYGCGDTMILDHGNHYCENCPEGYLDCYYQKHDKEDCFDWCIDSSYWREGDQIYVMYGDVV